MLAGSRSLLSLLLTSLALACSILAFSSSYWCEGQHKVVKPPCLSPIKTKNCGATQSQPSTAQTTTGQSSSSWVPWLFVISEFLSSLCKGPVALCSL
ncbi:Germ cell-specific gene 1-like protein [Acipenser ruthenus]|uniref:Germ cell-specific gene 1-like protein n=1 Tax=Acipenser ruthenus TaxID=7906 RepID=A0A444URM2_ACIRT|nr:Germ cell-specific gene 1-like protein [Acipenser ruthenus]